MRPRLRTVLLIALSSGLNAHIASGQVVFSGPTATGTYIYYHQDVLIHDVVLTGTAGSEFRVIVYNGSIQVGTGLYGLGIDGNGTNGIHGTDLIPPGAGQPAGIGYSVHLETRPCPQFVVTPGVDAGRGLSSGDISPCALSPGVRPMNISIIHGISLNGGNGGRGANGNNGYFDECSYIQAEPGHTATAGAKAGNCTIIAAGDIGIGAGISTRGGQGGDGGSGGSGIIGGAGVGREGRNGGAGGTVTVRHGPGAPAAAACGLSASQYNTGWIDTSGGWGGQGGSGGTGNPGPQPGGNGGPGGDAGAVVFQVRQLGLGAGPFCGGTGVSALGGGGGHGGSGGSGSASGCFEHYCEPLGWREFPLGGSGGASAGMGGDGGKGGKITATIVNDLTVSAYAGMSSDGGPGGSAGISGNGGTETFRCEPRECESFSGFSGGQSMAGGEGGSAGLITVSGKNMSFGYIDHPLCGVNVGGLSARGGDAQAAVNGAWPGVYCCHELEAFGGMGTQGGPGGHGGDGNYIYLNHTGVLSVPLGPLHFGMCGGKGSDGGDGSNGRPAPGAAGVAGSCGTTGKLVINGSVTVNDCGDCDYVDGQGGTLDLGLCIQP
jgi:hypothetical protein